MKIVKIIFFITVFFLLTNCNTSAEFKEEVREVMNALIDCHVTDCM